MRRLTKIIATTLVVLFGAVAVDLTACGDKFLRFGRSARQDVYAAIHPASILLYVPDRARPSDVQAFESVLRHAGHRPLAVRGMDRFLDALGTNAYDIVIANYVDAPPLRERAASLPSKPSLLPIVYKAKKAMRAEIQREYGHLLNEGAAKLEILEEIDHVMKDRTRQGGSPKKP